MSETRTCPNCRAAVPVDAPEGVCPACALRAGFDVAGTGIPTRTSPARRSPPIPAAELARRLPELEAFELIGQGGMGAVYRARHRNLDRPVAVKVLDAELSDDAAFAERFTREARTLAQLDHPNVVTVYDFGRRDGLYYLIMEFVDGVNLRQTLEAGALEPQQALAMVPRICEALQYAHDHGVVHRDIKPENILIDLDGTIKIADFGLAKLVGGSRDQRLTGTRQVMGTPHYMAPEQIEHPETVDHRADIYALGVVFYELLTGELPVGRFPPPSQKVAIDVRLDDVVLRTLEKEPGLRYQQVSELRSEIEALESGPIQSAPPAGAPRQADAPRPYEYRSNKTVFGIPLVHIAFSGDASGKRMRVAMGIIAIGDVAVGGVALGGMSVGLVAIGGLGAGLVTFAGLALGLMTAMGGVAIGSVALGGLAIGIAGYGALHVGIVPVAQATFARMNLFGWLTSTVAVTVAGVALVYAWAQAETARRLR